MNVNGVSATLHMPRATTSRFDARGKEQVGGLAPAAQVNVYSVDDYPDCPKSWDRSDPSINLRSFFFASRVGHMVWIDFNYCTSNPHHVAVIMSAQGVNAITGRRVTYPLHLEQYKQRCPNHDVAFTGNRFCAKCDFEWPGQNYLASNVTPRGAFWRDGFRGEGGVTREFLFTEQEERGVAAQIIGDERVDAFSLAYFLSKEPKPVSTRRSVAMGDHLESVASPKVFGGSVRALRAARPRTEVGAGAMVNQSVHDDTESIDFWQDTPTALIRIYYCSQEELAEIVGSGPSTTPNDGSFLGNIPKGNKIF
jgi:hypothetical protein